MLKKLLNLFFLSVAFLAGCGAALYADCSHVSLWIALMIATIILLLIVLLIIRAPSKRKRSFLKKSLPPLRSSSRSRRSTSLRRARAK